MSKTYFDDLILSSDSELESDNEDPPTIVVIPTETKTESKTESITSENSLVNINNNESYDFNWTKIKNRIKPEKKYSYDDQQDNKFHMLCRTKINEGSCPYGSSCHYAHSLKEQILTPIRKRIYDTVKGIIKVSELNPKNEPELYQNLLQLTRVCEKCNNGICHGGYNCRNGAINIKNSICIDDLKYHNCKNPNCIKIHLSKIGFLPTHNNKIINRPSFDLWKNKPVTVLEKKESRILNTFNDIQIQGVPLRQYVSSSISNASDSDSIDELIIDVDKEYDSDKESIFLRFL
ncbi:MAG: hypothetical protein CMF62_00430 [Magnetococcales bacterium]|nr:hypothetical protein [Magnetococcales bacterium]|tara:strand:+ start:5781 stop:6653 length:873 start_codon:yes stop_codon:yes gene_type:complete